jgi:UDP-N-acetylmuramate--alanine ligase
MTHVHLIGIGGSGLSAIARLLIERGYTVSGSDQELSPLAQEVQAMGGEVNLGHRQEQVLGADLVIRSSAIPDANVEVRAALDAGIPVYKRSEYLGKLTEDSIVIAVAGTHGKTTTTAMISWMFTYLDQDPSYIIGGVSNNLGNNAHAGQGSLFVIEADEYDRMFLGLQPEIAIVTNVEHDHPDCFPTAEDFFQAFVAFVEGLPENGLLLVCSDDPGAVKLLDKARANHVKSFSYGLNKSGENIPQDYSSRNLAMDPQGNYHFEAYFKGTRLAQVALGVPGLHNAQNALAALAVAHHMNMPVAKTAQALKEYSGTGRRFEVRSEVSGIAVIDDYAHHPTEIRATLAAARNRYPDRQIWAVWQPHTYSRTLTLQKEYLTVFNEADHVLVTEVYASREPFNADYSAIQVVQAMEHRDARFLASNRQVTDFLVTNLQSGDVLIVLSAGDAIQISQDVVDSLSRNGNAEDV